MAAVSLVGCAADRHHRQLTAPPEVAQARAAGDEGRAFDRFLPPVITYGSQHAFVAPQFVTPGQAHVPAGPPPASPPPLPVVHVERKPATPFVNGHEPPIRIGRQGRTAPPASQRGKEPLSYARIDSRGNLIDAQGRVLYQAGLNSPAVDTAPPTRQPTVIYDTTHTSPRQLVARSTNVPRVTLPGEGYSEGIAADPRAVAPTPGVRQLGEARIKQFQIRNYDLPDDRDYNVRVDSYPAQLAPVGAQPTYPAPAYVAPAPAAQQYVAPAPMVRAPVAAPAVIATPAPAPMAALGPKTVTQVSYTGAKERRVQRLYKRGMKDLKKKHYRLATGVFKKLLKRYPNHDLADNAMYWMAEAAYARGEWLQAMTWFQDVILRFPEGNKLPDAMLKSALCYARLGDTSYAVLMLSEVETLFGELPVAKVARERRLALSGGM